jgi:hypothetical protein
MPTLDQNTTSEISFDGNLTIVYIITNIMMLSICCFIIYYPLKIILDKIMKIWIQLFPTSEIIVNAEPYNELANVIIDIQEAPQIQVVTHIIQAA